MHNLSFNRQTAFWLPSIQLPNIAPRVPEGDSAVSRKNEVFHEVSVEQPDFEETEIVDVIIDRVSGKCCFCGLRGGVKIAPSNSVQLSTENCLRLRKTTRLLSVSE